MQTHIKLHISILLAGMTGVFGKLISLNEGLLVWYRLLLTSVIFFVFLLATKKLVRISFKDFKRIALVGALLAIHWILFYGSIKASNISVGVVCFSTIGFFTAIFEPILLHRKFSLRELFFSVITLFGVFLIFSFDMKYRTGIALGILSAAMASLFTIATKKIGDNYAPKTILMYEMLGGLLVISCLLPIYLTFVPVVSILPSTQDWIYLILFCVFCTIGLQLLQIQVLKKMSAFTVNLSYNLEPVYSIAIAIIFLGEAKELTAAFYTGVGLIILSIVLQMLSSLRENRATLPLEIR